MIGGQMPSGMSMAEKKVLDIGLAILGSYGGFVNNNIAH